MVGKRYVKVALTGVPNVGKSVIFNKLTKGKAWIGNWPGVTVEKKVGKTEINNHEVEIIDLPGIYGLTAYSVDELIARNFIVEEKPDVVVCIVSAINLERSLYLAISLLEMGANLIIDLNMIDIAENEGFSVNHRKLSEMLGTSVVPTIAPEGYGIEELKEAIKEAILNRKINLRIVNYGRDVELAIEKISSLIKKLSFELSEKYQARWLAIKLLEGDEDVTVKVKRTQVGSIILGEVEKLRRRLGEKLGDVGAYIIETRYKRASEITHRVLERIKPVKITITDILDSVLTQKILGIPIALSVLMLLFRFAFEVSTPLVDAIDLLVNVWLHDLIAESTIFPRWLASLLADGVISGIGSVLIFLPVIAFFFLGFAILEDVGYMARVAFIVDKFFSKFRLPGKAIIPLVIGFGCNVPAVMAVRGIEDENDRKALALVAPFSSCNARLPVYLVIGGAVLGAYAGIAIASMYVLSIILALIVGLILRSTLFKGPFTGFIIEMPPYLTPRLDNIAFKTWERTKRFLFKAGTVIFLGVILIWLLSVFGPSGYLGPEALENAALLKRSWSGVIGHYLSIIFSPMGWDWRSSTALLFGFVAKETVVGVMGVLYGVGEEGLTNVIAQYFTPISAYAYMIFVLTYVPCLATIAMIRNELGLKYALFALFYEIVLAYLLALTVMGLGHIVGVV